MLTLRLTTVGSHRIERELGRGGMGVVYLALDTRLDRLVAIKALPTQLAGDPERLARFEREARIVASLNHPGIAAVYALEEHEGRKFLIMEYVEGETLAARLKRGRLPLDEARTLAIQIAEALEAAHEKGVIHRDLKPGNVMLTPEGRAKVLDFGLARTADHDGTLSADLRLADANSPTLTVASPAYADSPTIPGAIMGTAGYMSPEQARGKPVDKRCDIFSFGCVLYEMVTAADPFRVRRSPMSWPLSLAAIPIGARCRRASAPAAGACSRVASRKTRDSAIVTWATSHLTSPRLPASMPRVAWDRRRQNLQLMASCGLSPALVPSPPSCSGFSFGSSFPSLPRLRGLSDSRSHRSLLRTRDLHPMVAPSCSAQRVSGIQPSSSFAARRTHNPAGSERRMSSSFRCHPRANSPSWCAAGIGSTVPTSECSPACPSPAARRARFWTTSPAPTGFRTARNSPSSGASDPRAGSNTRSGRFFGKRRATRVTFASRRMGSGSHS